MNDWNKLILGEEDSQTAPVCNGTVREMLAEIDRLKAELESKDKAIKLLQGHCNALMDTEGKLAQWKKGHTAGQEAAGYYQKQADDMIRQLRKELSDENANFTEEIMNLELQLAEARAEVEKYKAGIEVVGHVCMQERGASVPGLSSALLAYPHNVRVLIMKLEG